MEATEQTPEKDTVVEESSDSRTSLPETQQDPQIDDAIENASLSDSKEAEGTVSSEISTSVKVTEETLDTDLSSIDHVVSNNDNNVHSSTEIETENTENSYKTGNVDSISGDGCVSEAMETEQEECQTSEEAEQISETPCEERDETEPMDQE